MDAQRMADEQRRQRHVDVGAVEVERIARRHDEAHDRLGHAQPLELGHELRQRALRRGGAEHDQQLVLYVGDEAEDAEARDPGDDAEHDHHEQRRRDVEDRDQAEQVAQRRRSEPADREGHRAERAEGGGLHDDADHAEDRVAGLVDDVAQLGALVAHRHQREAEEDGEQQHLQDVAPGEGADDRVGDDVDHEVDRLLRLCLLHVGRDRGGIGLAGQPAADIDEVADDQADHEREGRDDLEIDQRLHADAADLARVLDVADAGDDGAEDDRCDHHPDQADEAVAQRLHPVVGREVREQPAGQDAQYQREQHLDVEHAIPRPGRRRGRRACHCCHCLLPTERRNANVITEPIADRDGRGTT